MQKNVAVTIVTIYLLVLLGGISYLGILSLYDGTEDPLLHSLLFQNVLIGGFGGVLYCLRGVYLNRCVRKAWDNEWIIWYIIRPVVSLICGGVSFLFLKAGLLILEAKKETDASNLGFYALAFIAGLNVDKFIAKIEDLAKATWGIEKSKSSADDK